MFYSSGDETKPDVSGKDDDDAADIFTDDNDDESDPVPYIYIYETTNFSLVDKVKGQCFSYATYFKVTTNLIAKIVLFV